MKKIDYKKFNTSHHASDYVDYYFYKADNEKKVVNISLGELPAQLNKQVGRACLSGYRGVPGLYKKAYGKDPNRLLFDLSKKKLVDDKLMRKWILACKKHGMLPKYMVASKVVKDKAAVIAYKRHTQNMIYIYVTMLRALYGYQAYVKNALYLYSLGVDFYAAVAFACKIRYSNMNHHFLPATSNPGYPGISKPTDVKKIKGKQLADMIGLYRFINDHKKHNNSSLNHFTGFTCNQCIQRVTKVNAEINIEKLFMPELSRVIRTLSDAEIDSKDLKAIGASK